MDCSLLGCSVHRILQARILESVAMSLSRGSSWPWARTHVSYVSCMSKRDFPGGSDGEAPAYNVGDLGSVPGLNPEAPKTREAPKNSDLDSKDHY